MTFWQWLAQNKTSPAESFLQVEGNTEELLLNGPIQASFDPLFSEVDKTEHMGITGFQYGLIVHILSSCWRYGEVLRRWHNRKYGAPQSTGVVNPAVLVIGTKSETT